MPIYSTMGATQHKWQHGSTYRHQAMRLLQARKLARASHKASFSAMCKNDVSTLLKTNHLTSHLHGSAQVTCHIQINPLACLQMSSLLAMHTSRSQPITAVATDPCARYALCGPGPKLPAPNAFPLEAPPPACQLCWAPMPFAKIPQLGGAREHLLCLSKLHATRACIQSWKIYEGTPGVFQFVGSFPPKESAAAPGRMTESTCSSVLTRTSEGCQQLYRKHSPEEMCALLRQHRLQRCRPTKEWSHKTSTVEDEALSPPTQFLLIYM